MTAGQQQQPERDTEQGGEYQPARAAHVDLAPVLDDHQKRDGNRNQHCQRSGTLPREPQDQQWNRQQRFTESQGRSNQRRHEDHQQHVQCCAIQSSTNQSMEDALRQ